MSNSIDALRPEGMTVVESVDGQFLFPKFLIPWAEQRASQIKAEAAALNNRRLPARQNELLHTNYYNIAYGAVQVPPDPPLTYREIIQLHSEVCAFATDQGLTWMNATRELYMLEVAKLEAKAHASNTFVHLQEQADGLRCEIQD
ncbi:hypothetical protein DXG01_004466 [Tephrocybe rancida]|nr:hypothetical protein DXG01_004466 [Tephrocybe rancida]